MRIFISYRRVDTRTIVGRLHDRLVQAFDSESIFMDVDSIPLGADFRRVIRESLQQSDVILFMIGSQWLSVKDDSGKPRLDDLDDAVRIEVETALQLPDKLIIPVLVENTPMPSAGVLPPSMRELVFKNAVPLRDDPDFHRDVTRLIERIQQSINTVIQSPREIHTAIDRFYQLVNDKNWDLARKQFDIIKNSEALPRFLDLSRLENVLQVAEKERGNASQMQADYGVLRVMAKYESPEKMRDALFIFWESYPDYDPDDFVTKFDVKYFDLCIDNVGNQRIDLIKVIRQLTNLGLAEAKTLTEEKTPFIVLRRVSQERGQAAKVLLEEVGAQTRLIESLGNFSTDQLLETDSNTAKVFNVYLENIGHDKINVVKAVRKITSLGLAEAKHLVETAPPILILDQVKLEAAILAKMVLEQAGAVVRIS